MKPQLFRKAQLISLVVTVLTGLYADRCLASVVCAPNSGNTKRVCVQWSQQADPYEGTDFIVDYECTGCADAPGVELRHGDGGWVVYSEVVSTGAVANIGALTTTDSNNYRVKIAKGSGPGAANVTSMVLTPSGDHYSSIAYGSRISGDLTGDLTLQSTSGGAQGALSLIIDGDTSGTITAPNANGFGVGGDALGAIRIDGYCLGIGVGRLIGSLEIGTLLSPLVFSDMPGDLLIGTINSDATFDGSLHVYGSVSGTISIDSLVGTPQSLIVEQTVTSSGSIVIGEDTENMDLEIWCMDMSPGTPPALPFDGTIRLEGGIKAGEFLGMLCGNESTGTLDLNGQNVAGSMDFHNGGECNIVNGGAVTGTIEIGNTESPVEYHVFAGTATFDSIESNGRIVTENAADLAGTIHILGSVYGYLAVSGSLLETGKLLVDGDIAGPENLPTNVGIGQGPGAHVDGEIIANADGIGGGDISRLTLYGEFNGNICGDNLSPMQTLPENISIATFGSGGTICGARPGCGDGTISASNPADGTRDARRPHPSNDCSLEAREGIGSADEPIVITLSEGGANSLDCWALCETDIEDVDTGQGCGTLDDNAILSLTETSSGVYEIVLARPISGGHWTTVTYQGDESYVTYASLPANANGDTASAPADILAHIDCCLNQICTPPFGIYSCDIDHSGVAAPADVLTLIDLLNGAGKFITWNGQSLTTNSSCPGDSMMGGAGGEEQLTSEEFVTWIVAFFTSADPSGQSELDDFNLLAGGLIGWADGNFSKAAKESLANAMSDPTLGFASQAGADAAADIVSALDQ